MQQGIQAGKKVVVVDFFATWCGPCRMIAPTFEEYSNKYPAGLFLKVDVDKCKEVQRAYGVRSMPTFIFFRGTTKIDQMTGADPQMLEQKIQQYCSGENDASASVADGSDCGVPGFRIISTDSFMDPKKMGVLNAENDDILAIAFKDNDDIFKADDEQMIISVGFRQVVKIHSLRILAPEDGSAPMSVKIFANPKSSLDFDDAERIEPTEQLSLSQKHAEGELIPLKFVNFQSVTSLTIFFESNQGDVDNTAVRCIQIIGNGRETTNMSEFKRVAGEKGERE
eukprot:UC4_evm2s776